jgi:hypothetical protein
MKRSILFIGIAGIVALGLGAAATQAARNPLFSATTASSARSANVVGDAGYRALSSNRATTSLRVVQADASLIGDQTDVLPLGLGDLGTAFKQYSRRNADGSQVWYGTLGKRFGIVDTLRYKATGEIADDPNNSVMIVRQGNQMSGTIRANGQLYTLQPLAKGGHVIARIDEARMPADHPSAYTDMWRASLAEHPQVKAATARATALAPVTVRVMVVFSTAAANAVGNTTTKANLAISESNQSFANSGANVSFQLAGVYTANYTNSSFDTDLSRFRGTADGYLDSYHTTRNSIAADVNVLITTNTTYCGLGYLNSTAASAFSVTSYSCMTGYYSFAHEIGHNFGARHDPATDPATTPVAYAHGYRSPTNAWRTIMAYNCSPSCPRINYWSNPAKTYGGQAMGTTTRSNNARQLNERVATVAAFR